MGFNLCIRVGDFEHPPFRYDTCDEARAAVDEALTKGFYAKKGDKGGVTIQLGAGSVLRLISDEALQEQQKAAQAIRHNPLLAAGDSDAPWKLVVQVGTVQLQPLDVASDTEADDMVSQALHTGVFRHTIKADHDYLYVQTGPGILFLVLPTEQLVKQRRGAIEAAMRRASAAAQQQQSGGPRIVLPPGSKT